MVLDTYITYEDVKGINISYDNSIFFIKTIYKKYSNIFILDFLSFVTKELGPINDSNIITKIQKKLGIIADGVCIHTRSLLVLYQVYFETTDFNEQNIGEKIPSSEMFMLFILANQILTKTDTFYKMNKKGIVTIEHLMTLMRMHIGLINGPEIRHTFELFIKFYEKLKTISNYSLYNETVFNYTGLNVDEFIDIARKFKDLIGIENKFDIYNKFAVANYEEVFNLWGNRYPKIKIPLDYRFFEQYPLIKYKDKYYLTSVIMLFFVIIRKVYHILSSDEATISSFRGTWGKEIVEPVIKRYIKEIFEDEEVIILDKDAQNDLGYEITDLMMVNNDDIYLIEIKSGYMGLEERFTTDVDRFKDGIEKRYINNSSGNHQLINQLDLFQINYEKLVSYYQLAKEKKYKVFSSVFVYEEAFYMLGAKRYFRERFNNLIKEKFSMYDKFLPYPFSNLFTFTELLTIANRIPEKNKRLHLFKTSFIYPDSFFELIDDIKERRIKVDGIEENDIV